MPKPVKQTEEQKAAAKKAVIEKAKEREAAEKAKATSTGVSRESMASRGGYVPRAKPKPKPASNGSGYKDPLTPGVAASPLARGLHQAKEKGVTGMRRFLQLLGGK